MHQLALFPDSAVTGTGRPHPWPVAEPEPEDTTPADTDQLAFDETGRKDAHQFVPTEFTTEAIVPVDGLVTAIKRACLVAGDGKPKILIGFGGDDISVRAAGDDTGAVALDHVEGRHVDGPPLQIAFQPAPILDALTVSGTDHVRIGLTAPTRPALIHAHGDDATDYWHLVMPVRL